MRYLVVATGVLSLVVLGACSREPADHEGGGLAAAPRGDRRETGRDATLRPGAADDRPEAHHGANATVVEKVQRTLDTDSRVGPAGIHVEAREPGVMRLTGRGDAAVKQRAEELARDVAGVERVDNQISVSGEPGRG